MRLVLNLIAKGACELFRGTFAFLAQKVLLTEMIGQISINATEQNQISKSARDKNNRKAMIIVLVKIVATIGITKVTKIVISPQMPEELISIHVAFIAVFAQRMSTMRCVVWITFSVVCNQLCLRVAAALECKDLYSFHAQITEEHVVFTRDMISQRLERPIRRYIAPIK